VLRVGTPCELLSAPISVSNCVENGNLWTRVGTPIFTNGRAPPTRLPEALSSDLAETNTGEAYCPRPLLLSPQLSDFDLHLFSEGKHWHAMLWAAAVQRTEGRRTACCSRCGAQRRRVTPRRQHRRVTSNRMDGTRPSDAHTRQRGMELFIPDLAPGRSFTNSRFARRTGDIFP